MLKTIVMFLFSISLQTQAQAGFPTFECWGTSSLSGEANVTTLNGKKTNWSLIPGSVISYTTQPILFSLLNGRIHTRAVPTISGSDYKDISLTITDTQSGYTAHGSGKNYAYLQLSIPETFDASALNANQIVIYCHLKP